MRKPIPQKETKIVYNNISMKLNLDQAYSNGRKQVQETFYSKTILDQVSDIGVEKKKKAKSKDNTS